MRIRDARPVDREALVALDPLAPSDPGRVRFIDEALQSADCIVAEKYDHVVGYAVLDYAFFSFGFVSLVYVDEHYRRRGIGRALVQALAARCRTPRLFSSTNQSNQPMRRFLDTLGFEASGIIYNLDPSDPELVFVLDLASGAA
jgi:ribosomal protein S18 acetylase RimI-like enzyme